ncbi:MAG: hypothetical protein ACK5LC_08400 [Coprobacillaceae bacterium]
MAGELKFLPFDLNWDNNKQNTVNELENIQKLLQTAIGMYDPNTIVLYCSFINEDAITKITENLKVKFQDLYHVKIEFVEQINDDLHFGLKQIANHYINPALEDNK